MRIRYVSDIASIVIHCRREPVMIDPHLFETLLTVRISVSRETMIDCPEWISCHLLLSGDSQVQISMQGNSRYSNIPQLLQMIVCNKSIPRSGPPNHVALLSSIHKLS